MLQSKECICTNIKKCNKKSLSFCCAHHQTLFINTVLNIDELTNLSESILKIKSVRTNLVKNAISIISNIINILALLKQNAETECWNRIRWRRILCTRNISILRQICWQNVYTTMIRCTLWIVLLCRRDSSRDLVTVYRYSYIYSIFLTTKYHLFTSHLCFLKSQMSHCWQI